METMTKPGWNDLLDACILSDLTEKAKAAGIKIKVGVTKAVVDAIGMGSMDSALFAMKYAATRHMKEDGDMPFQVRVTKEVFGGRLAPVMVPLKCRVDADDGTPYALIMLPQES